MADGSNDDNKPVRFSGWFVLALLAVALLMQVVYGLAVYNCMEGDWQKVGTFGDMFGGFAAFASGVALTLLVWSIHLQRQDLSAAQLQVKLQTEELELTRLYRAEPLVIPTSVVRPAGRGKDRLSVEFENPTMQTAVVIRFWLIVGGAGGGSETRSAARGYVGPNTVMGVGGVGTHGLPAPPREEMCVRFEDQFHVPLGDAMAAVVVTWRNLAGDTFVMARSFSFSGEPDPDDSPTSGRGGVTWRTKAGVRTRQGKEAVPPEDADIWAFRLAREAGFGS